MRASAPGRAAASLDLALAPLERVERAVALAPDGSAPAAALRGVLRARSGRAPLDAEVVLFDARGTAVARRAVERDADPALARFAFEGLAPGGYEVRATARSIYRWSPASLAAHAPSHGLELAGDDLAPTRVLVFRARDAADGRELPQIEVVLAVDGHEEPIARTSALGAVTYAYVPADARGAPVEGAEVQADGAEVARTGADGRARVRLPSPPRELTVPGARALPRGLAPGFRLLHVVDGTSRADLAPGSGTSGGR